jgi:hypothetical protein
MTARAAHARRLRPEVVYAEPGVMVSRFSRRGPTPPPTCAPIERIAALSAASTARCRASRLRRGLHVLGVPRHPRLCPHARRSTKPHGRRLPGYARTRRRAGGGAAAAADRLRPQRPAAGQLPRRRRAALADRFRICRFSTPPCSISPARLQRRNRCRPVEALLDAYFGGAPPARHPRPRRHAVRLAAARGDVGAGLRTASQTRPAPTTTPIPPENLDRFAQRSPPTANDLRTTEPT